MSSQHKAPLAAFLVVSIACIVVVVNALRSDALSGLFASPTQAVVAGVRLVPQPQDILSAEAKIVVGATAGLKIVPDVAQAVVGTAGHAAAKPKHAAHRGAVRGTAALAIASHAPATAQPAATGDAAGTAVQTHPSLPEVHLPTYGHSGQRGNAGPAGHSANAWGTSSSKNDKNDKRNDRGNARQDRSGRHESHGPSSHSANGWAAGGPNGQSSRSNSGDRHHGGSGDDHVNGHRNGHDRSDRGNGWGNGRHSRV